MQPAVFIARIIGPTFAVIGLSMLLDAPIYTAIVIETTHSPTLIYFSGLLSLPIGIAMLNVYRAWTADWRAVVTLLGWVFLIGGIVRILLPQLTASLADRAFSGSAALPIVAAVLLVIGGWLSFEGYRKASGA